MMEDPQSPVPATENPHCMVLESMSEDDEAERENLLVAHDPNHGIDDEDTKSQTFRKRRLTYTKHHLAPACEEAAALVVSESPDEVNDEPVKKPRLVLKLANDAASETMVHRTPTNNARPRLQRLSSKILHSGELKRSLSSSSSLLMTPHRAETVQTDQDRRSMPAWRHRHAFHESDATLPFPRHVVGTYSCHGVEPVYDSDYSEDEEWTTEEKKQAETKDASVVRPCKLSTTAKINQDRGGILFPYGNSARTALFSAYDGHGQGGELVSQYAMHEVGKRLEKHADFDTNIETAFKETFLAVDEDLKTMESIEPLYAGTTACVVLLRDNTLTISNAGDSRAVLARKVPSADDEFEAIDLSRDHNPDVPEEQRRIEESGGFVSPPPEPGLSARVWLDSNFSQIGLAMARSIGDHAVTPVGVIAEPEVTTHEVTQDDEFFIVATDGVWEFISSEEAVGIVAEHLEEGATRACQALIEAAAAKWHEEEGNYRDDITALVVRLQELWDA